MSDTGKILGAALAISEQMVWRLRELEKLSLENPVDYQPFNEGMIRLNTTLRQCITSYCEAVSEKRIEQLAENLDDIWISLGVVYPRLSKEYCLQTTEDNAWHDYIRQLEQLTALQMILSQEADNTMKRFKTAA